MNRKPDQTMSPDDTYIFIHLLACMSLTVVYDEILLADL